jgi:uncharacterized protein
MDHNITKENLDEAVNILKSEVNPFCIYLLGSASRNELREDSDIDIAFLSDEKIDSYNNFMIAQQLYDVFKRQVDLINLEEASTVFKAQVAGKAKVIYCSDNSKRCYFEMRALKEYALLNEEREVIFKGIKERGNIYG